MVHEGLIDKKEAVLRVDPAQIDQLLHPMIDPKTEYTALAKGLPASPGAAVGRLVFTAHEAEEWANRGEKVILARTETSPEDIGGMDVAEGILTSHGGMTSHAAVVARGMGKCCVAGVGAAKIDEVNKTLTVGDTVLKEGDWVTLNGTTGELIVGKLDLVDVEVTGYFGELMAWAEEFRAIGIRTNAETPPDAEVAKNVGAEGIGLCRTEHMFFEGDRIKAVRQMILAKDKEGREAALAKLLPYQKGDFKAIFEVMDGMPVTIRLLDPPLHEFLPHEDAQIKDLAEEMVSALTNSSRQSAVLAKSTPCSVMRLPLRCNLPRDLCNAGSGFFEAAAELTKEGKRLFLRS